MNQIFMQTSSAYQKSPTTAIYRVILPNKSYSGIEALTYREAIRALMGTHVGEMVAEKYEVPLNEVRGFNVNDLDIFLLEKIELMIKRLGYRIAYEKMESEDV